MSRRLSLELDDDVAAELDRVAAAERAHPEQYAASLLSWLFRGRRTLDSRVGTDLLDRMPGATGDGDPGLRRARRLTMSVEHRQHPVAPLVIRVRPGPPYCWAPYVDASCAAAARP